MTRWQTYDLTDTAALQITAPGTRRQPKCRRAGGSP